MQGAVIGFVSKIPSDAEKKFLEIADREDFRATFAITDVAAVKVHVLRLYIFFKKVCVTRSKSR